MQQFTQRGIVSGQAVRTTYPGPLVSNPVTRDSVDGGISNAWTVEEQIYKSKMWLQQRNQSMLPNP